MHFPPSPALVAWLRRLAVLLPLALPGCADPPQEAAPERPPAAPGIGPAPVPIAGGTPVQVAPVAGNRARVAAAAGLGTGSMVGPVPFRPTAVAREDANGVTLSFLNAEARDVARAVLGEVLGLPYTIDPELQGQVTLETTRPIARAAVLPVLESALRGAGIALVNADGTWRVLPLPNAARGAPMRAGRGGAGFGTQVVPLRWVAAPELERALEPILPAGVTLRADAVRNLVIVSGPAQDTADTLEQIAMFDVDAMRGLSFALIPLRSAPPRAIAAELTRVMGLEGGAAAGMVRIVALDRVGAILATSIQPAYLERVRNWVARLDQGGEGSDRRLHVYRVQNGRASDLATVLGRVLGTGSVVQGGEAVPSGSGETAEGMPALQTGTTERSRTGISAGTAAGIEAPGMPQGTAAQPLVPSSVPEILRGVVQGQGQGVAAGLGGGGFGAGGDRLRVTADTTNNALLVHATGPEWASIQAALAQLDLPPLQVLIDASIAEVTLTGNLRYGLQYAFTSGNFSFNQANNRAGTIASGFPGFNFLYAAGTGSNVVISALEQVTNVRVLSSPNLLVLNNQTARLQVGDQVPIAVQSATGILTANAPIVNSIEYRDTGVILRVTPRVNANGLVLLDIAQEVSEVAQTTSSTLNTPTIQQRRMNSSVAIHDGETVALGGLIRDRRSLDRNGLPLLQDIPWVGALFGTRETATVRTELIVLLTPRVVRNAEGGRAVTEELRARMPQLQAPAARLPARR